MKIPSVGEDGEKWNVCALLVDRKWSRRCGKQHGSSSKNRSQVTMSLDSSTTPERFECQLLRRYLYSWVLNNMILRNHKRSCSPGVRSRINEQLVCKTTEDHSAVQGKTV